MTAYDLLLQESERVGWPKHYVADLTRHDRNRLLGPDAPERFVWALRECGTWLMCPMAPTTGDTEAEISNAAWLMSLVSSSFHEGANFYWYESGRLTEISVSQAKQRLFTEWARSLSLDKVGVVRGGCPFCRWRMDRREFVGHMHRHAEQWN